MNPPQAEQPRGTLIVCTLSLLYHWENEIAEKLKKKSLKVHLHYGKDRLSPRELKRYDVVLTTYGTLSAEFSTNGKSSGVHSVAWWRVVLDEAHTIKNWKAKVSKAACNLTAHSRWGLTGTPVQNTLDDLWSLLHFLRLADFIEDRKWWNENIIRPLRSSYSRPKVFMRMQTLLQPHLLRRTKDQKVNGKSILHLPSCTVQVVAKEMSAEENQFYQLLWKRAKRTFSKHIREGTAQNSFIHILETLLRVRQACDHPYLVLLSGEEQNGVDVRELNQRMFEFCEQSDLLETGEERTGILPLCNACGGEWDASFSISGCSDNLCKSVRIHLSIDFQCVEGIEDFEEGKQLECPQCNARIKIVSNSQHGQHQVGSKIRFTPSSLKWFANSVKLKGLLQQLRQTASADPSTKSLIFSQFTTFLGESCSNHSTLDLIEIALTKEGILYARLDGGMTHSKRQMALEEFRTNPKVTVFLTSLRAGGVGLNLTEANQVFLMDPWWNVTLSLAFLPQPAIEQQAIDRVYRLGQTKEVTVTRFVIKVCRLKFSFDNAEFNRGEDPRIA